jgi:hypothetical protein
MVRRRNLKFIWNKVFQKLEEQVSLFMDVKRLDEEKNKEVMGLASSLQTIDFDLIPF